MAADKTTILGPDGNPLPLPVRELKEGTARQKRFASDTIKQTYKSFVSHLYGLNTDPLLRSEEPFENHAFVYAAAMARAVNLSQAPFQIYQETEETVEERKLQKKKFGQNFTFNYGKKRRAVQRHLDRSNNPNRFLGFKSKKLEVQPEHPLVDVFHRPNPIMTGHQLWMATELWMALRGECFWMLMDEEGNRTPNRAKGDVPGEIYPLSPDLFRAIVQNGRLVGWRYEIKDGNESIGSSGVPGYAILNPNEVIQFKYFSPQDIFRGAAPLSPAASAINLDMMAHAHNRSILENGADPGGILIDKGNAEPWSMEEEQEFLERWEQRHRGPNNTNELAILTGGIEYVPTGLSLNDMQYSESLKYNMDQIFAAERVPKTIVGITENINYSTQLGQDSNFWDKTILPQIRYYEDVIDGSLMFQQPDSLVGAFDLSGVEALRAGLSDKVDTIKKLCDFQIHMPPETAFRFVGIEPPEYSNNDNAMANPMLATIDTIAESPNPMGIGQEEVATEPVEESLVANKKYESINFSPPKGAREEAKRGLEWRSEFGRGGTEVGIARARDIAGGKDMSPSTIGRMVSFFARHEVDKKAQGFRPGEDGYPSNGRIAWALWGGDSGRGFANKVKRQMDAEDKKKSGNAPAILTSKEMSRQKKANYNKLYVEKLQGPLERKIIPKWRAYINEISNAQMLRFDQVVENRMGSKINAILRGADDPVDETLVNGIILETEALAGTLSTSLSPIWADAMVSAFTFTVEEDFNGLAVLSVDDDILQEYLQNHSQMVLGTAPRTIQRNLRRAASASIEAGETVQEMRQRFANVFKVSGSSSKALQVARTESGTYLSNLREEIFTAQGVEEREWSTASDERVRRDHVTLGSLGPQPKGVNYMSLLGKAGVMTHPHDPRAPGNQVVNCRCVLIPVI